MYLATKTSFEKVVLSSPMLDIKTGVFPEFFAVAVAKTMIALGFGESYIWNHGPYDGQRVNRAPAVTNARFIITTESTTKKLSLMVQPGPGLPQV